MSQHKGPDNSVATYTYLTLSVSTRKLYILRFQFHIQVTFCMYELALSLCHKEKDP